MVCRALMTRGCVGADDHPFRADGFAGRSEVFASFDLYDADAADTGVVFAAQLVQVEVAERRNFDADRSGRFDQVGARGDLCRFGCRWLVLSFPCGIVLEEWLADADCAELAFFEAGAALDADGPGAIGVGLFGDAADGVPCGHTRERRGEPPLQTLGSMT